MKTTTDDFPDWFGPMLVKELRQGLKTRAFVSSFILLQVALILVVIYHVLLYSREPTKFNAAGLNGIFWMLVGVQLAIVTPVRALSALAGERKANTLELIFMTGLSSWRIAVGKWGSLMFQAILFLLAVLPYGILRYFFGGVNLTEDLVACGTIFLLSGTLTAIAIAISGLPIWIRVAFFALGGMLGIGIVPGFLLALFGGAFGFGVLSTMTSSGGASYWWLLVFNAGLITCAAMEAGAASIAPPAENHALRQRLFALASLIPVPLLAFFEVESAAFQWGVFLTWAGLVSWRHLAVTPNVIGTHVEPWTKLGPGGWLLGSFLQPGWPGALLFSALCLGLALALSGFVLDSGIATTQVVAGLLMGAATLLTGAVLWRSFRKRSRNPLFEQAIAIGIGGIGASFLGAMLLNKPGSLGDNAWLALYPPLGYFAMFDDGYSTKNVGAWLTAGVIASSLLAVILFALSIPYWKTVASMSRAIRSRARIPEQPAGPLSVA